KIASADIIINTTSVGMTPQENEMPIPSEFIKPHHVVYDIVYTPKETKLLKTAKTVGAKAVYGDKMVFYGAIPQFELFTDHKAPKDIMQKALEDAERKKHA
ncbi:MAG: shikimate dehydrogenase, partial [Candidatus Levybacteria bacterium]|nr:shikimate dehydrogenase [Candidatus Levybacteria bacterium]